MYSEEELDKLIETWHCDYDGNKSLADFLGWSWDEYRFWVLTGTQPDENESE